MAIGPAPAAGRRVAITGVGVVSPLGNTVEDFYRALAEPRSGLRPLPPTLSQTTRVQVGGLVDWDPAAHVAAADATTLDRVSHFAIAAAAQALAASGLDLDAADRARTGVYWGTGMGGAHSLEAGYRQVYTTGDFRVRPLMLVMAMSNAAGANVSMRFGLRGPCVNYSSACASSAMALGEAMRAIRGGYADVVVAGGAEALLTPGVLAAWQALRTLAPADPHDPGASCRPFDRRRAGLVLGEGAAAFVLEAESHARARGAPVRALLTGYGSASDATHLSRPDRDGQARAMRSALDDAGLAAQAIGYVNAHATGTILGDVVEAQAIRAVFGDATGRIPTSSTKSLHGHLLGAAGALELAASLLAFDRDLLPPTAHLEEPDPACDLRHVARKPERAHGVEAVMSNSFAFGGANAVLIAQRR